MIDYRDIGSVEILDGNVWIEFENIDGFQTITLDEETLSEYELFCCFMWRKKENAKVVALIIQKEIMRREWQIITKNYLTLN